MRNICFKKQNTGSLTEGMITTPKNQEYWGNKERKYLFLIPAKPSISSFMDLGIAK